MFEHRTINEVTKFSGVGVHSGVTANVILRPAELGTGIVFVRSDVKDKNNKIIAHYNNVSETLYSTQLSNDDGVSVRTIEHFMAAVWAMKISNLIVEIDSIEMPIMDGCSQAFCLLLDSIGTKKQKEIRKTLVIKKDVEVVNENRYVRVSQYDDFKVTFYLQNKHAVIENGSGFTFTRKTDSFITNVSLARTFCDYDDIEKLKSMNLAKGGSLDNAVVVKNNEILNKGLRYHNEFVRHKVLDLIGDISVCDYDILGHFIGHNSGHQMNNELMKKIFSNSENFEII